MDYTNFVRTYYRLVMNKLRQCKDYSGSFADPLNDWNIPKEFLHEVKETNGFLPSEEVIINAPSQYIETYIEYLGVMMPDIDNILVDKYTLRGLYARFLHRNGDNDEQCYAQMEALVNLAVETDKELGVLQ